MALQVLLTGGSGFLGGYVLKALTGRGDIVVNYDVRPLSDEQQWLLRHNENQAFYEEGGIEDISDIIQVIKKYNIEIIIHSASVVNPPLLVKHPLLAYRVNIGGTLNIVEAARLFDIRKVIYISTDSVFTSKCYEPIDENHPVITPREASADGPYGISKVASEAFGMSYADTYGFEFITLRPSSIYGFGMHYPMYIKPMVENAVRKLPTRFDTGRDLTRDYIYVKDVVNAVIRAVDMGRGASQDRIFLVATGHELVTPGELADIVREFIPGADIVVGQGLTEWNKKEISYRGVINIHRAREQLGFECEYDIRRGIGEYINLYKEYSGAKN